jgi:hypothetical protein
MRPASIDIPIPGERRVRRGERPGRLRLELRADAAAPLRSGLVTGLAPRGPNVYARLRFAVAGALADAELRARLLIHFFDPTCSSAPVELRSVAFRTDGVGDGTADLVLRVEDVPAAIRGATHGVRAELLMGAETLYRTASVAVTLS